MYSKNRFIVHTSPLHQVPSARHLGEVLAIDLGDRLVMFRDLGGDGAPSTETRILLERSKLTLASDNHCDFRCHCRDAYHLNWMFWLEIYAILNSNEKRLLSQCCCFNKDCQLSA